MNDDIGQQIADQLGLIAKALEVQNEHLRSIDVRVEAVEDQVNYVGQAVVGLQQPADEE